MVADVLKRYAVPIALPMLGTQPTPAAAAGQSTSAQADPVSQPTPVAANAGRNAGEALYRKSCAECHGLNAKGSTLAPNLTIFQGSDDGFVKAVLNGRPTTPMPPFKGLLSEDDIGHIRTYIKSLPR